ncbi:hypothetical protein EYC55_19325 [Xanthomonas oryzae]|nr:hypothetical protein EYC55_19325 [Xanthomonas oryzae]
MAPTINELTQAQRARLQMTETRERMRNGVHVVALPPGLVNLGDAARQRAGNASHAGSRKCSRYRRRQQHQTCAAVRRFDQATRRVSANC